MISLFALLLGVQSVGAQTATPRAHPFTPQPADCIAAPLPIDAVIAAVATPTAKPPVASPAALPAGTPADQATNDAVAATIKELFACTNAGDFLRVYASFTDSFIRDFFAGTPINDQVVAFLTTPPQPLPADQQRIINAIGPVRMLDNGRAVVEVVVNEPGPPRFLKDSDIVLVNQGGTWLIDQEVDRVKPIAGDTPDASLCIVEPRSQESLSALIAGTPVAPAIPTSVTSEDQLPAGAAADPTTAAQIEEIVRQLMACGNAGDFSRVLAFYSEDFLRALFALDPAGSQAIVAAVASPVPSPITTIVDVRDIRRFDDGTVGAFVIDHDPNKTTMTFFIFTQTDAGWLITGEIDVVPPAVATPTT